MHNVPPNTEKPVNWLGGSTMRFSGAVPLKEQLAYITLANRFVGVLSALLPDGSVCVHELELDDLGPRAYIEITSNYGANGDQTSAQVLVDLEALDALDALDEVEDVIGMSVPEEARVS